MLNSLRRGAKSVFAKFLIALLVLSFGVWGIADFLVNRIDQTEVARAGDTSVSAAEFDRAWRIQSSRFSQQVGQQLTPDQARALGLPQSVLQSLLADALQIDAARALGVDVSDDALAERIRSDPRFSSNGTFDRDLFDRFLANLNYSEGEFVELERDAAVQEMWVNSLIGGLQAPTPYLAALNRAANQTREVTYFTLTDDAVGPIEEPSEETLRGYYDDNTERFRSPERRTFSIVTLSPEALAEADAVSEDAVRRDYAAEGAYGNPERRDVQQVILKDADVAQKAADAIDEGYAFSAVLRQLGQKFADVDLGTVTKGEIYDRAVADAAFDLEPRKATVVDGRFGPTLLRVGEVTPSAKRPFEEVEPEIRQALALEEAVSQVRTLTDNVTDAIAGGARVAEVGERFDLPVSTVDLVDRNGVDADGNAVDIPLAGEVVGAAFEAEAGSDAVPVEDGRTTVWVQTDTIEEAAVQPFEDVSGDVLLAWTEAQKAERLEALAAEASARLKGGTPIGEVAASYGVAPTATEPFTEANPPQGLPDVVATAAFEGPKGHVAAVPGPGLVQLVLKVTDVSEPAFFEGAADLAPIQQRLDNGIANAMLFDLVTAWQSEVGATLNQPIIDRVIGVSSGS